jgi:hypothetical protein
MKLFHHTTFQIYFYLAVESLLAVIVYGIIDYAKVQYTPVS